MSGGKTGKRGTGNHLSDSDRMCPRRRPRAPGHGEDPRPLATPIQPLALVPAVLLVRHAQASFGAADYDVLSARGIEFVHGPRKTYWGYGVELADPDGYLLRLWDERTMSEK